MDGIELMAGAMRAAQASLEISAGNLANSGSDGFQRSLLRLSLTENGFHATTERDARPGTLRRTGRELDLAVAGTGGLMVRDRWGRVRSERSASFERDALGRLHDKDGRVLLGSNGASLVAADGKIDVRRIAVLPGTTVRNGFLEGANVDPIAEMIGVVTAQRAFETAQKSLEALDGVRSKASNELARVKS